MSDAGLPPSQERILAELHAEFRDGLAERLGHMDRAIEQLVAGPDPSAALGDLYRAAHSLKGTAMAYGATELMEPVTALAAAVRAALDVGTDPSTGDRDRFATDVNRLRGAVERYRARAEDGGGPA